MIALISARHEPQLVPALSTLPISSTLVLPAATAATIWLTPIVKQEQTVAPASGRAAPARPATMRKRSRWP